MIKKRKLALMACISTFHPSYSIAGIVQDQLKYLKRYGEDVILVVPDDFTDQTLVPKEIDIRYYPRYKGTLDPDAIDLIDFEKYVFECSSILRNCLSDCTHVIQHDLLFIHSFLYINWAIRHCATLLPKVKWYHWQHSAPSPKPYICEYPFTGCYMGMDNSTFVYLNRTDIAGVAERYNIPENTISVVHNFIDFETLFKLHPITLELEEKYNLFEADTICIYPTRMTDAKQIHKLIKIMENLRDYQKVKLIICSSWSNGDKEKQYLNQLKTNSTLTDKELIFTSEEDSKWCKENNYNIELGVPKEVVIDLMRISDLFILPSTSECCSMIMLEAAANKNLLILNDDVWSLHEFGGQKIHGNKSARTMYMQFGSTTRPIASYLPDEDTWYDQQAQKILELQKDNQAIGFFKFVRKRHNPKWVYFNEIKPLLE